MLKFDEQLYLKTRGHVGKPLDTAILEFNNGLSISNEFGAVIPIELLLVNKQKASQLISSIAQKHWGSVDLFTQTILQTFNIDLENATEKLTTFFSSSQGKKAIFDYLLVQNTFRFENLIALVFGKEIKFSKPVGGLSHFYLFKVGKKFLIHIIFSHQNEFWNLLFAKKVYSLFLQAPLRTIQQSTELMKLFKSLLETYYTTNQTVKIVNGLIHVIDFENPRSFQLKELHLLNVTTHFNGGKRHNDKLQQLISKVYHSWGNGESALTEKEETLLCYMLALDAARNNDIDKVISHGQYLIAQDRLNNHAIELLIEYSEVLPNMKPESQTLVKRYDKNYLEQIFYILIDALIQNKQFQDVITLLKEHEIASCSTIFDFLNDDHFNKDLLHRIEATVQKDIAFLVDNSPQYVWQSIEVWLSHYQQKDHPYQGIAVMTSKHVSNILKALFATEQYELFEKLMEIYKKYLSIEDHFTNLRDFVAAFVKN